MALIEVKLEAWPVLRRGKSPPRAFRGGASEPIRPRLVRDLKWSEAGDAVVLTGPGVKLDLKVDANEVHVAGDIPLLGGLLGGSGSLKSQIVEAAFLKRSS